MPKRMISGFTLIELLVIIAIIAILSAILAPVFARAREKGFESTCLNNQRQIVLGILAYTQDNDNVLPLPSNWLAATGLTKDSKLFHCFSSSKIASSANPDYGYNAFLFTYDSTGTVKTGVSLSAIGEPDEIEATTDMDQPAGMGPATDRNPFPDAFAVTSYHKNAAIRHQNGIVVSYLDGRVLWKSGEQLGNGTSQYNIPLGTNRYFFDFSTYPNDTAARAALTLAFSGTGTELPVAPDTTPALVNDAWEMPAGTFLNALGDISSAGASISVEYTGSGTSELRLNGAENYGHRMANYVDVHPATSTLEFGLVNAYTNKTPAGEYPLSFQDAGTIKNIPAPTGKINVSATIFHTKRWITQFRDESHNAMLDGFNGWFVDTTDSGSFFYTDEAKASVSFFDPNGKVALKYDYSGPVPNWRYADPAPLFVTVLGDKVRISKLFLSY